MDAVYTEKLLGLNKQTLCYCLYDKVSISYMQLFWLHCKQFKHVTCKECNQTGATSAINDTSAFDVQECLNYRFNPIGQCYMYSIDFHCCLCACLLFSVSKCALIVSTETFPALVWLLKWHLDYKVATPHITAHAMAECYDMIGNQRISEMGSNKESDDFFFFTSCY